MIFVFGKKTLKKMPKRVFFFSLFDFRVKMGSKETVHELKVKLYRQTQHSPVDQLLYQGVKIF